MYLKVTGKVSWFFLNSYALTGVGLSDLTFCLGRTVILTTRRQACWILSSISDQSAIKYQGTVLEKVFILVLTGCQADIV